jgi:hypothetical protein
MTTNDIIEIEAAAPGLRGTYKVARATAKAVLLKAEGSVVEFWAPRSIFKAIKSEVGGHVYSDWFTLPRWFRPEIKGV